MVEVVPKAVREKRRVKRIPVKMFSKVLATLKPASQEEKGRGAEQKNILELIAEKDLSKSQIDFQLYDISSLGCGLVGTDMYRKLLSKGTKIQLCIKVSDREIDIFGKVVYVQ